MALCVSSGVSYCELSFRVKSMIASYLRLMTLDKEHAIKRACQHLTRGSFTAFNDVIVCHQIKLCVEFLHGQGPDLGSNLDKFCKCIIRNDLTATVI